jgi:hypothetical protein
MEKLVKRIEELEALLAAALGRIVELEEQVRQNSRNSSKAPSSAMGRRKVPQGNDRRKPGGQPGHLAGVAIRPRTCWGNPSPASCIGIDGSHTSSCSVLEASFATRTFEDISKPCWKAAAERLPKAPC